MKMIRIIIEAILVVISSIILVHDLLERKPPEGFFEWSILITTIIMLIIENH